MRVRHSILACLFFAASIAVGEKPGLMTGVFFMDEEGASAALGLSKQYPDRRIIVVERDELGENKDTFLEKPLSDYSDHTSVRSLEEYARERGTSLQHRLARELSPALAEFYSEGYEFSVQGQPKEVLRYADGIDPTMKSKTKAREAFQIVTLNTNAVVTAENPPIVLIRSPEMGLQPVNTQNYLKVIFDQVAKMEEAAPERGGLNLTVFGVSGATGSHLRPGEINQLGASLFVGVERVPGTTGYQGIIALADNSGGPPKEFYRSRVLQDKDAAEAAVKKVFNDPAIDSLGSLKRDGTTLGSELRKFKSEGLFGGGVSLTVSFFGGEEEKETARRLGLGNVNMEDYHALAAGRNLTGDRDKGFLWITRYNSDPPYIPETVVKAVEEWAEKGRYTQAHYVDAILWGLEGTRADLTERIPTTAAWNALDSFPGKENLVYRIEERGNMVLDPFYLEISSDFLKEIIRGAAIGPEIFDRGLWTTLDKKSQDRLVGLLKVKNQKLSEMARSIQTFYGEQASRGPLSLSAIQQLRTQIGALVKETRVLALPAELQGAVAAVAPPSVAAQIRSQGGVSLLGDSLSGPDAFEVWVRQKKWKGNQTQKLTDLIHEPEWNAGKGGLDGANVDRAFYKIGLVGGLLKEGRTYIRRRMYKFKLREDAFLKQELARVRDKFKGEGQCR